MVICQICKKEFKRITRTHLAQHDLSTNQYKQQFPLAETIDTELRVLYGTFFKNSNPMKLPHIQQLISAQRLGSKFSDEHRANIARSKIGKSNGPRSQAVKDKISQSNKAVAAQNKEQGIQKIYYPMSDEALSNARTRMLGNTLGKVGHHNKGKQLLLTVEQRANRSAKRVEFLKNNKGIRSGTIPELKFIDFLNKHNIKYEHQHPIHTSHGSWLYDFWLPELELFVEVDGEYWHRKKKTMNRDKLKNKIIKERNQTLARISDSDLNFNIIFEDKDIIWKKNISILEQRIPND